MVSVAIKGWINLIYLFQSSQYIQGVMSRSLVGVTDVSEERTAFKFRVKK
jgi:hypothetical protein